MYDYIDPNARLARLEASIARLEGDVARLYQLVASPPTCTPIPIYPPFTYVQTNQPPPERAAPPDAPEPGERGLEARDPLVPPWTNPYRAAPAPKPPDRPS